MLNGTSLHIQKMKDLFKSSLSDGGEGGKKITSFPSWCPALSVKTCTGKKRERERERDSAQGSLMFRVSMTDEGGCFTDKPILIAFHASFR